MNNNIIYLISIIVSYLFGAIPFSYFIVKIFTGKDLRIEGSGNLGTLNSYEVSRKKWIGVFVLILDLFKGLLAIYAIDRFSNSNSFAIFLSGIFIVIGHNWNIFLKFRGGRGLAPSAGISIALNFIPVIIWLLIWLGSKPLVKNIHKINCMSSIISIIILWLLPSECFGSLNSFCSIAPNLLRIQFTIINILIIFGHWNVRRSIFITE